MCFESKGVVYKCRRYRDLYLCFPFCVEPVQSGRSRKGLIDYRLHSFFCICLFVFLTFFESSGLRFNKPRTAYRGPKYVTEDPNLFVLGVLDSLFLGTHDSWDSRWWMSLDTGRVKGVKVVTYVPLR